jgi:hypothetical protein
MTRKFISIVLSILLVSSLTACKKDDEDDASKAEESVSITTEVTTDNSIDDMSIDDIIATEEENINYNKGYFCNFLKSMDYALNIAQYFPEISQDEIFDYLAVNYSRSFCETTRRFLKVTNIELVQADNEDIYCIVYTEYNKYNVHFKINEIALRSVTEFKESNS